MSRFALSSLRVRLLVLVLLAVLPAFVLAFFTNMGERQLAATSAREEVLRLARLAAADQERLIAGVRQLLATLARLPAVRDNDPTACPSLLTDLLKQNPHYTNLGVMAASGATLCRAAPLAAEQAVGRALSVVAQRALETGDFIVGEALIGQPSRQLGTLLFAQPLSDAAPQRVVFAALDLVWLNQRAIDLQLPPDSILTMSDHTGTILVHSANRQEWVGRSLSALRIVDSPRAPPSLSTVEATGVDGVRRVYAFLPLREMGENAFVTVGIPAAVAFAAADRVLRVNLAGLALAAGFVLAVAWFGADLFILRRLHGLVQATERLSGGELSTRTGPPYGQGELGQLARAFDQMAEALEQREAERSRAEAEIRRLNTDLEQRVIERTAQLEAANKELEAFSYSVSHDLRAPLRAMAGFSRILMEDYAPQLPPDAVRFLRRVQDNAQQMGQLIDDLLRFSRMGRQALTKQPVEPADLVRDVLEELRADLADRQVDITLGDLPGCQADPALLKQAYINLLANALKFTRKREPACIEIGCQSRGEEPVYFVKDNGVGFDMRYANKLFGVFQRLHDAKDYEGTGVGLALVQRVILRHGGRLWAEAEVEKGATFFFTVGEGSGVVKPEDVGLQNGTPQITHDA